jgi:hypothetical protein
MNINQQIAEQLLARSEVLMAVNINIIAFCGRPVPIHQTAKHHIPRQ